MQFPALAALTKLGLIFLKCYPRAQRQSLGGKLSPLLPLPWMISLLLALNVL